MPQTTVIPDWKATYPIDAAAQKVPGLVPPPSTTLIANAVPNKPQPWTATSITAPYEVAPSEAEASEEAAPEEETVEEEEETEEGKDENGHPKPRTTHHRGSQPRRRR